MFQDRDEYGEVGEGVRDLVEMTIKKMDLDRYFFLDYSAFSNLLQFNNEDPRFQGRAHLLLWLQHDGEPRAAAAGGLRDVSTHQPAGDGLGQEDSGQAVRQYVRIDSWKYHVHILYFKHKRIAWGLNIYINWFAIIDHIQVQETKKRFVKLLSLQNTIMFAFHAGKFKFFETFFTLKGCFSSVYSHVTFQLIWLFEPFTTLIALVWSYSRVDSLMSLPLLFADESFATPGTRILVWIGVFSFTI